MTHPTDAAIAQAWTMLERIRNDSSWRTNDNALWNDLCQLLRARELDAEKGGACCYPDCNCPFDHPGTPGWCARGLATTPPAQAAEAVERVARAIFGNKWMSPRPDWATLHESTRDEYRLMARAAIAAMTGGEHGNNNGGSANA